MKKSFLSLVLCSIFLFSVVVTFSACHENTTETTMNNEQPSSPCEETISTETTTPSDALSNTDPISEDSAYNELGNSVHETTDAIEAVMSVGVGSISFDEYNSELFTDYRSAVQAGNGYMCINLEKAKEIAQEKIDVLQSRIQSEKETIQAKILENEQQSKTFQAKIDNSDYKDGETAETIAAGLETLTKEYNLLMDECTGYDVLLSELKCSMDGYQQWMYSLSAMDYGDISHNAVQAIQWIADTYNSYSDIYCDFGSRRFCAAVEWIVSDIDPSDVADVEEYMNNLRPYILLDDNSQVIGLNYNYFMEQSINVGLIVEDSGSLSIADNVKMSDFSEKLGLSEGMTQAFFDEFQSIGWTIDFTE